MLTTEEVMERVKRNTTNFYDQLRKSLIETGQIDPDENIVVDKSKPEKKIKDGKVVRLSDLVSDNFRPFWKNKKPYNVLKGGRSSFKSSNVSLKLVERFMKDSKANTICFRKVGNTLRTSVYEQIKWAIYTLNVSHEFTFLTSPMRILHNPTGTAFYFYGVDDPQKIKSHKIAQGYVTDLWFEEAAEFDGIEEIDIVTDTFIREDLPDGLQVDVYFTYNPPRNPYVWINEWVKGKELDDDYYIHHSTYLEDTKGFLSEQFKKRVEKIRVTDPDYYDWMYGGKVTGLGDVIYNFKLFQQIDQLPADDKLLFADISLDTGYSTSATSFGFNAYTVKRNVIRLDTYYYDPRNRIQKKAPSEFSKDLWNFYERNKNKFGVQVDTWTIDSADGALRNQFYKDYGISLTPAKKKEKPKMIENVEDILAQGRVFVLNTENNQIFLEEHKNYRWDEKSLEPGKDPKVVKEDDHTCDEFQYYVNNNLSKLGLKF